MEKGYKVHFKTDTGKIRTNNEDGFGEHKLTNGHLLVVCDGMGGHLGGEFASQKCVECIIDYCKKSRSDNAIIMIHEAIKFANTQVHGFASTYPEYKGMGTTCVVVFFADSGSLYYGHVGDSRLYAFTREGLKSLTKDHSYVQYLVDTGEINESEMENHPSKNQILRAIGIDETIKPDVCSEPYIPEQGDLFLLCTDGLNGMINNKAISAILNQFRLSNDLSLTADELISAALEAGGRDNVTVGLLQVNKDTSDQTIRISNQEGSNVFQWRVISKLLLFLTIILVTVLTLNHFFNSRKDDTETRSKVESGAINTDTIVGKSNENKPDKTSDTTQNHPKGNTKSKDNNKTNKKVGQTKADTKKNLTSPESVPSKITGDNTVKSNQAPPQATETSEKTAE